MILRNTSWEKLAEKVRKNRSKIVVYGAGMIGKTIVPTWVETYDLGEYMEFYVDMDIEKIGRTVRIGEKAYEIYHPDRLKKRIDNLLLLIANNKFYSMLDYLDKIPALDHVEGYIASVIQVCEFGDAEPVVFERISDRPLIPKKIHYCWFGNKKMTDLHKWCIESWHRYCPDYEIKEWNETNCDISETDYTRQAYEAGKFGFVPDYFRLKILVANGGIYLDTDVELFRNLDDLLYQPAFVGVERCGTINMGGMSGSVPGHPMIQEILEKKKRCRFIERDGRMNAETCGVVETLPFVEHGMKINNTLQRINGVTVYPSSVCTPYDYMTGQETIRNWTVSKHHFCSGWMDAAGKADMRQTQEKYRQVLARMNAPDREEADSD